jgi:membrane protease YdiL (CAAX protease family)
MILRDSRYLRPAAIMSFAIIANVVYFWVARVLLWSYPMKAAVRLSFFFILPLMDWLVWQHLSFADIWRKLGPRRRNLKRLAITVLCGAAGIVAINIAAGPASRVLGVSESFRTFMVQLGTSQGSLKIFLIYLPIVNALAEELFFRFYIFLGLWELGMARTAMWFSAALFALYHLSIIQTWFPWPLILAMLAGLMAAGLFLNQIARRDRHIFGVWLIHGLVNILIITLSLQYMP